MNDSGSTRPNGFALLPFLVFVVFYLGLSLQAGDFYKVPMPIAFVVASAAALFLGRPKSLGEKIDVYAASMGEPNIMIMCMVFILAGSFATIAKGSGAVDAAVAIAQALKDAQAITEANNEDEENRLALKQDQPLTPYQLYYLDYQLYSPELIVTNLPYLCSFPREAVDPQALKKAVDHVTHHFAAFGTVFMFNDAVELIQRYCPDRSRRSQGLNSWLRSIRCCGTGT
jgi:hypothetical protein